MPLYTASANTSSTGYKNLVHNGAMAISQRDPNRALTGGVAMTSASGTMRLVDRWAVAGTSGAWSVYQGAASPPPGFNSALQFTCTTAVASPAAASYWTMQTDVEGFDAFQLAYGSGAPKTTTLSFWANVTGMGNGVTMGGAVRCWYGGSYRSYGFTYTVTAAGTWQKFSIVVPGDGVSSIAHDSTGQMSVIFTAGVGSQYVAPIANTWVTGNYLSGAATTNVMLTANAALAVTGVQLELGSSATNFEYRSRQVELSLCQRYLYIVGNMDASGISGIPLTEYGIAAAQNYGFIAVRYPVQMRAVPTFSYSSLTSIFASDRIGNFTLVSLAFQVNGTTSESSNAIGDLTFGINAFSMTTRSPVLLYTAASGISWLQFAAET